MATNKIEAFGEVLMDLTNDTVSPQTLLAGTTAHDKSGAIILGEFEDMTDAIQEHINDDSIHVTLENKDTWNGKQNAISDIDTIRANAKQGSFVVADLAEYNDSKFYNAGDCVIYNDGIYRVHENLLGVMGKPPTDTSSWEFISLKTAYNYIKTHKLDTTVHVTEDEKAKWNEKQDKISDIQTIREGSAKGSNAIGTNESYNPEKTYILGDYVIYNNKLYRAIVDTFVGISPDNINYWEQVSLKSLSEKIDVFEEYVGTQLLSSSVGTVICKYVKLGHIVYVSGRIDVKSGQTIPANAFIATVPSEVSPRMSGVQTVAIPCMGLYSFNIYSMTMSQRTGSSELGLSIRNFSIKASTDSVISWYGMYFI